MDGSHIVSSTDDYISFITSIQDFNLLSLLSCFLLTLARIVPIITLAPFLGSKNLPGVVRMLFSVVLCFIFLPQNLLIIRNAVNFDHTFIALMCKELLIGVGIGLFATVPFLIAETAGTLIDHSRGSSSLQVTDPMTHTQTGPIGVLYSYVLIVVFFSLNGPFIFFNALGDSYQLLPIDQLLPKAVFTASDPFWKQVFNLAQRIMNMAVQLASPAIIGVLLTDLFLGIANRMAPQVQIVFLGISLKSWVGISMVTAAWFLTLKVMGNDSIQWMKLIREQIFRISGWGQ